MADDEQGVDIINGNTGKKPMKDPRSLAERAAEKLAEKKTRSLAERAGEKLAETARSGGASPGAPEDRAKAAGDGQTGGADSAKIGATGRANGNYEEIDLMRLQLAGYITPHTERTRMAEEYRIVKRPLLLTAFMPGDRKIRNGHMIMVTSCRPGEGKTFTAINLAMSIASERDLHVMLIDTDVHQNDLIHGLGIKAERGLVDLLIDENLDVADVLIRTNVPNLSVLPAGTHTRQATELMASQRMVDLANDIAARYSDRVVIIDAPPVLASSEPGVLAMHVGQVVMVVEVGRTSRRAIEQALSLISVCKNISFVLNKTGEGVGSHQFGAYSYYGGPGTRGN